MRMVAIVALLLVAACGRSGDGTAQLSPVASTAPHAVASPAAAVVSPASLPASASRTEPQQSSPPPVPAVNCTAGVVPTSQAWVWGVTQATLYDVSDPLHPRAVCRASNTSVHIVTGTSFEYLKPRVDGHADVVLHSLGSNNESVAATFDADLSAAYLSVFAEISWSPSLNAMAYEANGGTDANASGIADVWLATASGRTKIYSYSVPGIDGFARPGPPAPVLAFSADGAYLAAGWAISPGSVRVFRISDLADVTPVLPKDFRSVVWAKAGHRLFMAGSSSVSEWTPGSAVATLPGTTGWVMDPNFSPDGTQVAFTGLSSSKQITAFVYDLDSRSNRILSSEPRSSTMFVKAGWVWYVEEAPCVVSADNPCFDSTSPDGKLLAIELATGRETEVVFAPGEGPFQAGYPAFLTHGDVWPSS